MIARMNALSRWVLVILLLLLSLLSTINAHAQATRAVIDTAPEQLRAPPPPPPGGETMYNDASFGTQSVPTTMTAGATYTVTLSMFNSGTKTWSPALSYALGSRNPTDNVTWGGGRVGLAGFINPGQSATFTFNVTAPSSPGSYNFQWGMVQDGVEWFGVLSTNVVVNVVAPARVNGASIVGMSVTGQMTAGLSYPATIVMHNTGNTTWTSAALYSLGAPQVGGVQYWNGGRVPLPGSIAPGQQVSFSFNVTAPANAGTYPFNFLMVQDGVEFFGQSSNLTVNVSAARRNDAQFVSQTVPATMVPGQTYPVTVVMQNTGNTTWNAHGDTGLASSNPLANNTWNAVRIDQPTTTAPGQTAGYTFQVTAPAAAGTYNFQWKMVQDQVEWFGATSPNLAIQVAPPADTVTYIHTDALGSPVARSDSAGNVISRTSYEPYGRTAGGVTPTIGFTGHVNDADTGLVYMQQRYYDPVAGRFLSVDPVVTDANSGSSFNRFAYANNSPYKYLDRDGRGAITIEGCIVACTGITVGWSNGELAATLTVGVGLGGGFSYDPRSSENGRITNGIGGAGDDLGGMTLAGYTKAGIEVSTPLGGGALGGKLSGGRDLATGKNIGGPSLEAGLSKPDKISAKATISSGAEVSAYIKPANVVASVTASLTATIVGAIKNLFTPPEEKP